MPQITIQDVLKAKELMRTSFVTPDDLRYLLNNFLPRFSLDMEYAMAHYNRSLSQMVPDHVYVRQTDGILDKEIGYFGVGLDIQLIIANSPSNMKFFIKGKCGGVIIQGTFTKEEALEKIKQVTEAQFS